MIGFAPPMTTPHLLDPARLDAIRATELLDTPAEECFDVYAREARKTLHSEMAIVSLVMSDRQFYKSCLGLTGPLENKRESPIAFSLCKIGVERRKPVVICDGQAEAEYANHPAITELKIRSYLGVPLFDENDYALGTLCVANLEPRQWTEDDIETLAVLARGVRNEILLHKLRLQRQASKGWEGLLGKILETSIAAVTVLNPEGEIIFCNAAAESVLGLKPSDLEGRRYNAPEWKSTDVGGGPWPDEKSPFQRVMSTGEPVHDVQHAIEWPDGTRRILSISGAPILDEAGRIAQVVFQVTDITEKHETTQRLAKVAEQFQLTFRTSPNVALLCDQESDTVVEVSAGFLHALKTTREFCVGKQLGDLGMGFTPEKIAALRSIQSVPDSKPLRLHLQASDNEFRLISVHAQTLEVGHRLYTRITGSDLTKQKRADQRRLALEAQLREAEQVEIVGRLASGLAHEFNNTLTAIIGHSELAARHIDSTNPAQRSLGVIKTAGQRAVEQVRQILSIGGRHEGESRGADVGAVIDECIRLARTQIPPEVQIKVRLPDSGVVVSLASTKLHQIISNLLKNAIQAVGKRGMIEIAVDAGSRVDPSDSSAGNSVIIAVRDDGPGIDPVNLDKVFEAFFTTKEPESGSGIGLTLVRTIARGHGGDIVVASEPGQGAVFRVELPCLQMVDEQAATSKDPFGMRAGHRPAKILVVDDDEALLTTSCMLLEQLGHQPTKTTDSRAALQSLLNGESAFDLLITDNLMPHLSGLELVQELRNQNHPIPILMVSGYGVAREQIDRLKEQSVIFLPKPYTLPELSDAINRALAG